MSFFRWLWIRQHILNISSISIRAVCVLSWILINWQWSGRKQCVKKIICGPNFVSFVNKARCFFASVIGFLPYRTLNVEFSLRSTYSIVPGTSNTKLLFWKPVFGIILFQKPTSTSCCRAFFDNKSVSIWQHLSISIFNQKCQFFVSCYVLLLVLERIVVASYYSLLPTTYRLPFVQDYRCCLLFYLLQTLWNSFSQASLLQSRKKISRLLFQQLQRQILVL